MAINTSYNPPNIQSFVKTALNFYAQGVSSNPTAGTITNIDLLLTDDVLITGAWLIINNANYGDYVNFQVVDSSGTFTGTAGTVLNQFITNWFIPPSCNEQLDMVYPAKIYAGLTLRVVYHSTGGTNPFVAVNYKLHKVLI